MITYCLPVINKSLNVADEKQRLAIKIHGIDIVHCKYPWGWVNFSPINRFKTCLHTDTPCDSPLGMMRFYAIL